MRKLLLIIFFIPLFASAQTPMRWLTKKSGSAPFSPKSVSGLLMWVYSDTLGLSNNDPVSTWTDLSGNGNDATQSGSARPTYKTNVQNSRAVLRFDGIDDLMEVANTSVTSGLTGMTIFAVVKLTTLSTNRSIITKWDYQTDGSFGVRAASSGAETIMFLANACNDNGGNNQVSTNASMTSAFYLLTYVYDGSQSNNADRIKIYLNGTLLSMSVTGTIATSMTSCSATIKIGDFGGSLNSWLWDGDMGEIALYNSALNGTDQAAVENYLKIHWGL